MVETVRFICRDCGAPCRLEFEVEDGQDCRPRNCVLSFEEAHWEEA